MRTKSYQNAKSAPQGVFHLNCTLQHCALTTTVAVDCTDRCAPCTCRRVTASYLCTGCGFPLCSLACQQGPLHQEECRVFSRADFEAEIEDCDAPDDHYAAILPLRCLALKQDPSKWAVFSSFLSHCEARRVSGGQLWGYHQEHSVEMLRDTLELQGEVSEEEIHRLSLLLWS